MDMTNVSSQILQHRILVPYPREQEEFKKMGVVIDPTCINKGRLERT